MVFSTTIESLVQWQEVLSIMCTLLHYNRKIQFLSEFVIYITLANPYRKLAYYYVFDSCDICETYL